jgi:hypothetical protein
MCSKLLTGPAMGNTILSENKEKLIKSIVNIIKKLRASTGMKREKYMHLVCKEFNLGENEKWVITKLRMILVRLNAGMELLQIRNSENSKLKLTDLQRPRSMKNTNESAFTKEYLISSVQQRVKLKQYIKAKRKSRKIVDCFQTPRTTNPPAPI